jgi:ketol-acid reductoisomerase
MKMNFGGHEETVILREEFPLEKAREILASELVAVIGYGVQGPAQSLNLRDNGFNVIVGQAKEFERDWNRAKDDGWVPGKTLFSIKEAAQRGTIIKMLVSDAAQPIIWPTIKANLNPGDALYFSHGFSIVYRDQTGIIPPENIDVIMVAPKGSGTSVRRLFLEGKGINSSYAIFQDYTKRALDRTLALGIAIGSGYMFETTFEKEVFSDLTGERGVLMGAIYGLWLAQYEVLREKGHSPSEAFNETVEEATQSLYPLIGERGMDWMYANCSATAQRGALDWYKRFRDVVKPVFNELYEKVESGEETKRVIEANSRPNYQEELAKELAEIRNSEMWQAGATVRSLRPEGK